MNFTVCAIAKNEAKSLPRFMKSLSEFQKRGGEVVLVDTGSTDNTVSLARSLGCKVFQEGDRFITKITAQDAYNINSRFVVDNEPPIVDTGDSLFNYAAARNHTASLATNDMVAFHDCDEEYSTLNIDVVEQAIKDGYEQFEYQFVYAHTPDGKPGMEFVQSKFYNHKKMQWVGIVHEVLTGQTNRIYLGPDIIKLEHYQEPSKGHRSRYLAGLAIDCYKNPENDRNSHYLGRELFYTGRFKSAIKELTRHVAMNRWAAERAQSFIFIGDCHMALGNEAEALRHYHDSFVADGTRREPLLRMAQHFYRKNDYQKVACYTGAALQIPLHYYYANNIDHYRHEPHELLYWAFWYLNRKDESKQHYDMAVSYNPTNPKYADDRQFYYSDPSEVFEYKDPGIEGWMIPAELDWLHKQAKKVNSILEIGSWMGRSTHALLSGCKGTVTCVDTFKGSVDDKADLTYTAAQEMDVYAKFQKNVGHFKNLEVLKMTSEEAAKVCKDRKFDMIFIDACHTYDEVKKDILMWADKATVIISGHDYSRTWRGVQKAVDECVGDVSVCQSIWYKEIKSKVFKDFPQATHPERLFAIDNVGDAEVILDLGCGSNKTLDKAVGVDIRPIADITADIDTLQQASDSVDLIISRHSFEHLQDPIKVLAEWWRVLKIGGRIVFVLPDHEYIDTLDPFYSNNEHMHAYTRASLAELVSRFSFHVLKSETVIPDWSFGLVVEKVGYPTDITQLQNLVERAKPFTFVKRGDGEEACMSGAVGGNCDGHPYSPKLGDKLKEAFAFFDTKHNVFVMPFADQKPYNMLLHRIDMDLEEVKAFYNTVRESPRRKVFIGPDRLQRVATLLKAEFISIPLIDAFSKYDDILAELKSKLEDDGIYMFSAGMPAKPLIAEALQTNPNITCLDLGSSFDPLFVGQTRTVQASQEALKELYSEELSTTKSVFTSIYKNNYWGSTESASGPGSDVAATINIRQQLPEILQQLDVHTVLDAACGDFNWQRRINYLLDSYIGLDIVSELVANNNKRFGGKNRKFIVGDIIHDDLPKVDLIICRDCLMHLPINDVIKVLQQFKKSGATYLAASTDTHLLFNVFPPDATRFNRHANDDTNQWGQPFKTGDWRPLDLRFHPFNFPEPLYLIEDENRQLGIWRMDSLTDIWSIDSTHNIPKRIFTIWFNDREELPRVVEKCLASQRLIPGYTHELITKENRPKGLPYLEAAIEAKMWAKASDYARMYELYERGGIYCDTDVEILPGKNFDDMLDSSIFMGMEESVFLATSVIGAVPKHPIIKAHLKEVTDKFKGNDGNCFESSAELLTPRMYVAATPDKSIRILDSSYFTAYNHLTGTINITPNSKVFHHFLKTWADANNVLPTVSIFIPTLGREDGLKRCLESIDKLYYPKQLIEVLIDAGESTVPVKVNRMLGKASGDCLVFAANDVAFTPNSLYKAVLASKQHGLVAFNTGEILPDKGNICEHFLIRRNIINKIGGRIFSEKFHHVGCDNLLWAKCDNLGEATRCEDAIMIHYHFTKGAEFDEVYERGWKSVESDRAILKDELKTLEVTH